MDVVPLKNKATILLNYGAMMAQRLPTLAHHSPVVESGSSGSQTAESGVFMGWSRRSFLWWLDGWFSGRVDILSI